MSVTLIVSSSKCPAASTPALHPAILRASKQAKLLSSRTSEARNISTTAKCGRIGFFPTWKIPNRNSDNPDPLATLYIAAENPSHVSTFLTRSSILPRHSSGAEMQHCAPAACSLLCHVRRLYPRGDLPLNRLGEFFTKRFVGNKMLIAIANLVTAFRKDNGLKCDTTSDRVQAHITIDQEMFVIQTDAQVQSNAGSFDAIIDST